MAVLIMKLIALFEGLLAHFLTYSYTFTIDASNEWAASTGYVVPTDKGMRLLGSLSSIIDNLLISVAQLMALMPAANGVSQNSVIWQ